MITQSKEAVNIINSINKLKIKHFKFFLPDNKPLMKNLEPLILSIINLKRKDGTYEFTYKKIADILGWNEQVLYVRIVKKHGIIRRKQKQLQTNKSFSPSPKDTKLLSNIILNLIYSGYTKLVVQNSTNRKNLYDDIELILSKNTMRIHIYSDEEKVICVSNKPKTVAKDTTKSIKFIEEYLNELCIRIEFESILIFIVEVLCDYNNTREARRKIDFRKYYHILKRKDDM